MYSIQYIDELHKKELKIENNYRSFFHTKGSGKTTRLIQMILKGVIDLGEKRILCLANKMEDINNLLNKMKYANGAIIHKVINNHYSYEYTTNKRPYKHIVKLIFIVIPLVSNKPVTNEEVFDKKLKGYNRDYPIIDFRDYYVDKISL